MNFLLRLALILLLTLVAWLVIRWALQRYVDDVFRRPPSSPTAPVVP